MNKREFTVKTISFNQTPPYQFSLLRIGLVFLLLSFCYLVRPKSHFYNYEINFDSKYQRIAILAVAVVLAYGLVLLSWMNPNCNGQITSTARSQYEEFSEMLAKGQLNFDYSVDPKLLEMENPYDPGARRNLNVEYKWDHAYYNGAYYMYFGIVPEVLTFLPYRLLSGQNLPTYLSVSICLLLLTAGVMSLLYQIIRQYFKKAKLMIYLMLSITFVLGSGITLAKYPTLYIVPIAFAVMLGVWGLNFWILAKSKPGQLKKNLSLVRLAADCLDFRLPPAGWSGFSRGNSDLLGRVSQSANFVFPQGLAEHCGAAAAVRGDRGRLDVVQLRALWLTPLNLARNTI